MIFYLWEDKERCMQKGKMSGSRKSKQSYFYSVEELQNAIKGAREPIVEAEKLDLR